MKTGTLMVLTGLAVLLLLLPGQAAPPKAKITPQQAKAAAVKKLGGHATTAQYEFEDGHGQYAVTVKKGRQMYEAAVNSTTGAVMTTEKTSAAEEAREAAADKKAAAKRH